MNNPASLASLANDKIIVMSAPNGARRSHADHPALPLTAEESALDAVRLRAAGAAVLHLHVRDADGRHSLDADLYRQAIDAIRDKLGDDLIIQVTTEAVGQYTPEEQRAVVRALKPEAVSLALREFCPPDSDERIASEFCAWMQAEHVWPQYILYSAADVRRFDAMRQRGVFADPAPFALFVLGQYADSINGTLADLDALLAVTDASAYPWAVCCFGPQENEVMLLAAKRGGHARLGFENNLNLPDGTIAPDNAALIRAFVAGSVECGRQPASPGEIRAALAQAP